MTTTATAERPRFISIEGGEGAGKSTQVLRLVKALKRAGHKVLATREPGGAPGAELIRALLVDGPAERWEPLAEALLHYAARRQHLVHTIKPALARGQWVVSDRFADSTLAYQGYGQGAAHETIETLRRLTLGAFAPDLTIILDLPVALGLSRAGSRTEQGEARYERMAPEMHERLREGFLAIAAAEPKRCAVVDASADVETVARRIAEVAGKRLGVGLVSA
jgi:dTMP kinase